ncbi:hypothetical protein [Paenibacillus sp. 32352]|uniref:hypothetical protein n=1 Tax=Paenibacillus sp. 32352 TaxID=1969111 RepID=UPI0009AC060A|nr:hypothetical protein [Paenibacillus sp. 32352]
MESKSASTQNKQSQSQASRLEGQEITQEQLSDVYNAGTSDGNVQLESGTMHLQSGNSNKQ